MLSHSNPILTAREWRCNADWAGLFEERQQPAFLDRQWVENMYRKNEDSPTVATPKRLKAHMGILANPVLGKPGTAAISCLAAWGFITAKVPRIKNTIASNKKPKRLVI